MITEWWTSLDLFMKILWGIALATSLIFIIQSILTFVGADAGVEGGLDAGFDDPTSLDGDAGMNLYTFRNLINFLLGFSWAAILLREDIRSTGLLLVVAVFVGIALVAIVMWLFKWLSGMQQSGNINIYTSAVGCQGKVYLTVPAERKGEGKVQIVINESVREYNAVTDGDSIPNGASIKVLEVVDDNTLLVEAKDSLII